MCEGIGMRKSLDFGCQIKQHLLSGILPDARPIVVMIW